MENSDDQWRIVMISLWRIVMISLQSVYSMENSDDQFTVWRIVMISLQSGE